MVNLKDELTLDASLLQDIKIASSSDEFQLPTINFDSRYRQPISPYISSTFVDLEEEFKHLHSNVFSQLNDLCQERGSYFLPLDFRRTSVDNRSSADLVLKHALDKVNSCLPFFICVIGSQYGMHRPPSSTLISTSAVSTSISGAVSALSVMDQNLLNACANYPWVLEKDFHTCSMMELEVILACFMPEANFPKHCFFYVQEAFQIVQTNTETILESESEYAQERLHNLKLRIIEKGLPVKFFTSAEELSEQILRDWTNVIMTVLPPVPLHFIQGDERFLHVQLQEGVIHHLKKKFRPCPDLTVLEDAMSSHAMSVVIHTRNIAIDHHEVASDEDLYSKDEISLSGYKVGDGIFSTAATFLETLRYHSAADITSHGEKNILAIIGGLGIGKTSLLTNWIENFRKENPEVLILSEFVGSFHQSRDVGAFLRRCILTLRENYFKVKSTSRELLSDVHSYESLVESFASSLQLLPCLIVIDSINAFRLSMGQDIGSIKALSWLPKKIPPSCKIIISTRQSDLSFKVLQTRSDVIMTWIQPMGLSVRKYIFENHLGPIVTNLLERELLEKIWNNKLSESPLFLSVIANLLIACRSSRERHQVIEKCTSLRNFKELWKVVFVIWSHRYSWNKNSPGQPGSVRGRNIAVGWVADSLKLIACSRCGLSRNELLHLLWLLGYRGRATVTPNDWDVFRVSSSDVLTTSSNGLIRIVHEDTLLVIRNSLFTSGRASSRATGSYVENKQQRYHLLLASYFVKFGSMPRKLIELPWQLQKSKDWLALCQILSKPRFFLAMAEASQWNSSLHIDHRNYWIELKKHEFDVFHCLKGMIQSNSEDIESSSLDEHSGIEKTAPVSVGDGVAKSRQTTLKGPSIIVVTQHDDVSVHKSTEDSKSETEDRDYYSETESSSFFITETEVEHHLLVNGWQPTENNPDRPIDDTALDEEESSVLRQKIAWFLYQLGEEFLEKANQVTETAIIHLDNSRPLSSCELLSMFETVLAGCQHGFCDGVLVMQQALATFGDLSLKTMDLSCVKVRDLFVSAAGLRLRLAEKLIEEDRQEEARLLILEVLESNKKWKCVYCKAQAARMFGKLLMSLGLSSQSEEMLLRAFAIFSKWSGRKNVDIALTLQDLGRLYSSHFVPDRTNQRKAMLAYKQALEIFQFNKLPIKVAEINNRLGKLLLEEGSLRSKKEAQLCFERSLNTYMANEPLHRDKIARITNQFKIVLDDLKSGRFTLGTAKPRDTRSPERPYSALTFHSDQLSKYKDQPTTPSTDDTKCQYPRSLMRGTPISRPYSSFSCHSLGGRMVVTPRKLYQRQSSSAPASRVSSRGWSSRFVPKLSDFLKKDIHEEDHFPLTGSPSRDSQQGLTAIFPVTQRPSTNEGKEHPVIIVPGEESRTTDRDTTRSGELVLPTSYYLLGSAEQRSEISTPKRSVRLHAHPQVIYQPKFAQRSHRCEYISGPEHISLTVHGPHSRLSDLLRTPPSFLSSSRPVDVFHKSAWFHVPGRYVKPGEVLPSKRSQTRPPSAATNSSYFRSQPVSRSISRQDFDKYQDTVSSKPHSTPLVESGVKIKIDAVSSDNPQKEVLFAES